MVDIDVDLEPVAPPSPNGTPEPDVEQWRQDKNGDDYVPRQGRPGIIKRQGEETIAQARARDALPKTTKRPRKPKRPAMPDAPRKVDLKELELTLAEALKQPAIAAGMAGDEWAADHFTVAGPYLARNLVRASEHNPWLRRKLEDAATGQDAMMTIVSLMPVMGGLVLYFVPPVIYWFNLPVAETTRKRFGIPPRKEPDRPPEYAAAAPQPPDPGPQSA
jgi:hypothetical protein